MNPTGYEPNGCEPNGFDMDDLNMELMDLDGKRYHCSQILMILGLRLIGRDVMGCDAGQNADLLRAAGGLTVGLGHSNETCGALLGGACLLGLYGGKGHDGEEEADWFRMAIRRLTDWFRENYSEPDNNETPSIRCTDILNRRGRMRCGLMVRGVYSKILELLDEYGVDPGDGRPVETDGANQ